MYVLIKLSHDFWPPLYHNDDDTSNDDDQYFVAKKSLNLLILHQELIPCPDDMKIFGIM